MILADNFRIDLCVFYSQVVMGILDKNGKMIYWIGVIMWNIISEWKLIAQSQWNRGHWMLRGECCTDSVIEMEDN